MDRNPKAPEGIYRNLKLPTLSFGLPSFSVLADRTTQTGSGYVHLKKNNHDNTYSSSPSNTNANPSINSNFSLPRAHGNTRPNKNFSHHASPPPSHQKSNSTTLASSIYSTYSNYYNRLRQPWSGSSARDAQSMAAMDQAVQKQLLNSQYYQQGLRDGVRAGYSNAYDGINYDDDDDDEIAHEGRYHDDDMGFVETEPYRDDDGDGTLDPNKYDNVQYN
ncbi:hypothetical protein FBU30_003722 [Linnemannia zychae]|nr:hypothetical protein FBU30_003722 [Linnemannia zychae]